MIKTGDCFPVILVVAKQKLFRILFERGVGSHSKPYVETYLQHTFFCTRFKSTIKHRKSCAVYQSC